MSIKIAAAGLLALSSLVLVSTQTASAQPAEYVRICSKDGPGAYYVPGTDTCINAKSGIEGAALSMATPNATVTPGHQFGAAVNVGTFGGSTAVGVSGAWQANGNLTVNGAVGVGDEGDVGGHGGINFSW